MFRLLAHSTFCKSSWSHTPETALLILELDFHAFATIFLFFLIYQRTLWLAFPYLLFCFRESGSSFSRFFCLVHSGIINMIKTVLDCSADKKTHPGSKQLDQWWIHNVNCSTEAVRNPLITTGSRHLQRSGWGRWWLQIIWCTLVTVNFVTCILVVC